jgi:glucokinase
VSTSQASSVIALDVGGTGIKGVVYETTGGVRAQLRRRTPHEQGTDAIVATIRSVVDELRTTAGNAVPICAVGLAVPGVVDEAGGVAVWSENLRWRDVPLRSLMEECTGLPVWLGHDVRAGGIAEFRVGAGKGATDAVFLPIGTGIAAALLIGGRLHDGGGFAGEVGHVDVGHGELCRCGGNGCLEAIASAGAIARRYTARTGTAVEGAREVIDRLRAGDVVAQQLWAEAIDALALALSWIASVLAPEVVIIGGGLSLTGGFLLEPLEEKLVSRLTFQRRPRLVPAAFGDAAACVGAAILASELA